MQGRRKVLSETLADFYYVFYTEDMEKLTGSEASISISVNSAYLQLLGFATGKSIEDAFSAARVKFYEDYCEQYQKGCKPLVDNGKWEAIVKSI